jgi:DHA2 family methylenomycin A resistance protein-like MFS transporter
MTTHVMPLPRERPYGLYAISFGFFLVLLDTTALNVATASIERELGSTISGLQWIVNSYTIVFASLVLSAGALGDRYGAKRLYQIGLLLFTAMSLLCALSPSVGVLIVLRMLQGLRAAIMLPASLALLSHLYPGAAARARAVSVWASVVSLGFAAGPALGGALTYWFGWRSIFLINVPIGVVAMLMIRAFVEETTVTDARRIDWAGQGALALSLFALTYALIEAGRSGWTAPRIIAAFATAVLLALLFAAFERKSVSPVLPRLLFSRPAFSVCIAIGIVLNFGMYGTLFIESLYLQSARHLSALAAGLMILPFTVIPTITTRAIDRFDGTMHFKPRLVVGHVVGIAGAAVMALSLWTSGSAPILVGLGLLGIAMGYIMPAMTTGVLTSSPAEMSGRASGILNAGRQVGGSLGVAMMGTLVQMQHGRGMLLSFALVLAGFLCMTVVSARAIQLKHVSS